MTHCHIMFTLLVTSHVPLHLQGYRDPLNVRMHELPISVEDAKVLFAEIREIRDFNRYVCSCTISYCKNMCWHLCHLCSSIVVALKPLIPKAWQSITM